MYPGLPGIDSEHSQKTLGICVCLEMVGKINTYKIQYFHIIERCTHLPVEIPSTPKKRG